MLMKRVLAALLMAAIGIPAIIFGGIYYFLLIGFFLLMAAWEYVKIFEKSQPFSVHDRNGGRCFFSFTDS